MFFMGALQHASEAGEWDSEGHQVDLLCQEHILPHDDGRARVDKGASDTGVVQRIRAGQVAEEGF